MQGQCSPAACSTEVAAPLRLAVRREGRREEGQGGEGCRGLAVDARKGGEQQVEAHERDQGYHAELSQRQLPPVDSKVHAPEGKHGINRARSTDDTSPQAD